jgi:hypothetical protein
MASGLKRIGDLDIDQDLAFQRWTWAVQRIAWATMGLLVVAAGLGLFGHGPLSRTIAQDPSIPLTLEYERFGRYQSPLTLRVRLDREAARDDRASLWVSHDFLTQVQLQNITPEPDTQLLSPTGVTYEFRFGAADSGGQVTLDVEPQAIGAVSGRIGLTASQSLPFTQWIYP